MRTHRLAAGVGAAALVVALAAPALADPFPVDEPFAGAFASPDWVLPEPASNSAVLTADALRLTSASPGFQVGNATLDDGFPSDVAFSLDFDYANYGGGNPGDAATVFLMDAAQAPNLGQSGGAAGYVSIQGAYLGIGFDNDGNFGAGNGFPSTPNTITLRGAAAALPTAWPVLADTDAPGGALTALPTAPRHVHVEVEPSGTDSLFVTVQLNATSGGPLQTVYNRVDVRGLGQGEPARPAQLKLGFSAGTGGATNNYEISNFVATADADLSVTKTGPATVNAGDQVAWTIVASNDDTNPAADTVVSDAIPAGLQDVSWTCASDVTTACPDPASGDVTGSTLDVPLDLQRDESATITVTGTTTDALAGSDLANTATITAAHRSELTPADNTATWTTRVRALPDLAPTVDVASDPIVYGQPVTWTVDVDNLAAPDGDAPDSAVSVTVPAVIDRSSITTPAGCTPSPAGFLCSLGAIAAGGADTLSFTGEASGALDACLAGDAAFSATTSTSLTDADPDNDTDTVRVPCTVPVDLAITKSGPATATVGDQVAYTVVVTNAAAVAAPATTVTDALPAGLDGATWTCAVSDGSSCAPSSGDGDVDAVATVPAGGSMTVQVTATASAAGSVTNTAVVTPCDACTPGAARTASATTQVEAAPTPSPTPTPTPTTTASPTQAPTQSPQPSASPTTPGGELSQTGSNVAPVVVGVAVLLLAGLVLLLVARRRNQG